MNFPEEADRDELYLKWQHVLEAAAHIKSWTSGHELAWLCEMASRSRSICEIGSYYGRSALCMALANPECAVICVDNCENAEVEEVFAKNLAAQIERGQSVFFRGTSAVLNGWSVGNFSGAFIDGGHTEADVTADIRHLKPNMGQGAIICGHDWQHNDPNDGVNRAVVAAFGQPNVFESIWWVRLP